jgi:hypothetical protein
VTVEKIVDVAINADLKNIKTGYIIKAKDGLLHVQVEDKVYVFSAKTGVDKNGHLLLRTKYSKKLTEKRLRTLLRDKVDFNDLDYETILRISALVAAARPKIYSKGVLSYINENN